MAPEDRAESQRLAGQDLEDMPLREPGKPVLGTKEQRMCSECVEDEFLRAQIERDGHDGTCFYCEQDGKTFSINQMADLVDAALSEFYYRTTTEPPDHAHDLEGVWRRKGQPVTDVISDFIGYAAAENTAAEDIRRVLAERHDMEQSQIDLEEGPFDHETHYAQKDSVDAWDFEGDWRRFERSLKTETRYFNRTAETILTSIFEGIDGHSTISGRPVIVDVGPGTELSELYRARVFQAKPKLIEAMKRPDEHLGPPPPSVAVAGRMNAGDIAVFYAATDPKVALAEVRPPVGSKVLIGRFEVIRPLRLLDLQALEFLDDEKGSFFDEDYVRRLRRGEFLRGLSWLVSKPVMPDDQPRDYLPTQAVADFLATAVDLPLDGMIYRSVQFGGRRRSHPRPIFGGIRDGRNVVLFHHAARVQPLDIPEGTDISVSDGALYSTSAPGSADDLDGVSGFPDDGPEVNYTVLEKVLAEKLEPVRAAPSPEPDDAPLKFLDSEFHDVRGATFETVSSPVPRYRYEKPLQN
jgi:hypothetical protein